MKLLIKYIPFFVFIMTWESVVQWLNIDVILGGWWIEHLLQALLPFAFLMYYIYYAKESQKAPLTLTFLYLLLLVNAFYGFFMSEGYQDNQKLFGTLIYWMLPLGWYYLQEPDNISKVTRTWCRYSIPFFLVLVAFMQGEAVGRYFAPFAFILIFYPYLNKKWKLLTAVVVFIVLLMGALGARSSVLRFGVAIILALAIYLRRIITQRLLKITLYSLLVAPVALLILGITDTFNIFKIQEELGWKEIEVTNSFDSSEQEDLTSDTRTFLYVEEIESAIRNNYVFFGRSISRGYDSVVFDEADWKKGRNERSSCEVRMLNVFNYMGIVGVVVVSLVYIIAAWRAVYRSKSFDMKIVGVYVAFRWLYAWIEDFDRFDLINLYLWIPIFMCYSSKFLEMTDNEFKCWIKNFFKTQKICLKNQ